jgi:hypothetical protein
MKQREWFEIGVRLFGVWLLLHCIDELRYIAEILFRRYSQSLPHAPTSPLLGGGGL